MNSGLISLIPTSDDFSDSVDTEFAPESLSTNLPSLAPTADGSPDSEDTQSPFEATDLELSPSTSSGSTGSSDAQSSVETRQFQTLPPLCKCRGCASIKRPRNRLRLDKGSGKYSCEFCGRLMTCQSNMRKHRRVCAKGEGRAVGRWRYSCPYYKYTTTRGDNVRRHIQLCIKTYRGLSGEKGCEPIRIRWA